MYKKHKNLLVFFVVTIAIAVIGSIAIYVKHRSATTPVVPVSFFSDFDQWITKVTDMHIASEKEQFTMRLKEGGWHMLPRYGYPVNHKQVYHLIMALRDMKIIEKKTEDPNKLAALDLAPESIEMGTATRIILGSSQDNKILADIVIGKLRRTKTGIAQDAFYIRHYKENQAWLVKGDMDITAHMDAWLDKTIVAIPPEKITQVIIGYKDKKDKVTIERSEKKGEVFTLTGIPKGKKLRYQDHVDTTASALTSVRFEDVLPRNKITFSSQKALSALFITDNEIEITVRVVTVDGKKWVAVDAKALGNKKEAKEEADSINKRCKLWAYRISDDNAALLTRKMGDFL